MLESAMALRVFVLLFSPSVSVTNCENTREHWKHLPSYPQNTGTCSSFFIWLYWIKRTFCSKMFQLGKKVDLYTDKFWPVDGRITLDISGAWRRVDEGRVYSLCVCEPVACVYICMWACWLAHLCGSSEWFLSACRLLRCPLGFPVCAALKWGCSCLTNRERSRGWSRLTHPFSMHPLHVWLYSRIKP